VNKPHFPNGRSIKTVKNATRNPKQRYLCKEGGRAYTQNPTRKVMDSATRQAGDKMLHERMSLRAICRTIHVAGPWLSWLGSKWYLSVPAHLGCKGLENLKKEEPDFEMDEICTYVGKKKNKVWIWLVMHRSSRPIVAFRVGDRSEATCTKLWEQIPPHLRHAGTFYTDAYPTYRCVIPENVHGPQQKRGAAHPMERFNATLQARVSRLVRRSYSFAKSFDALVGAVGYFIFNYNLELNAA
jgi:IS1 family transposase